MCCFNSVQCWRKYRRNRAFTFSFIPAALQPKAGPGGEEGAGEGDRKPQVGSVEVPGLRDAR